MADNSVPSEIIECWTVRRISIRAKDMAVSGAAARGQAVPIWLAEAIEIKAEVDAGRMVLAGAGNPTSNTAAPAMFESWRGMVDAAQTLAAATGIPEPTKARLFTMLDECLSA